MGSKLTREDIEAIIKTSKKTGFPGNSSLGFGDGGLKFCSIASGSSGNCYLVSDGFTNILVDAGISGKRILEDLARIGVVPENVDALLLTHEHIDHVKSVRVLNSKIPDLEIYCTRGTWEGIKNAPESPSLHIIRAGNSFEIGNICVDTFELSHDAAEPCGYSFDCDGRRLTILTDSGYVTGAAHEMLLKSQLLVLESNHDVETLKFCRYPYVTKRRILSDEGHLSNETAGKELLKILQQREEILNELAETGSGSSLGIGSDGDGAYDSNDYDEQRYGAFSEAPMVLLAHLSRETNFPEMALTTVTNILEEAKYYDRADFYLHVLARDCASEIFEV